MNKQTNKPNIAAIVVTYNRKVLLLECLKALLDQTCPVDRICIIDNASTDGTYELLQQENILAQECVDYRLMDTNMGGAGGFYEGLKILRDSDADWIWMMDDDTIPYPNALEELVKATEVVPDASFLSSCVEGPNHEPMNVPVISPEKGESGEGRWYMHLDQALVEIRIATFVSILVNKDAVKACGLPCKDYFIWGDDSEYALRLVTHYGRAYMVGKSWVCHKRANCQKLHILGEDDVNRIPNYVYFYRNGLINKYIYFGFWTYLLFMIGYPGKLLLYITRKNGVRKFGIALKGVCLGVLQKKKFKNYIEKELQQ